MKHTLVAFLLFSVAPGATMAEESFRHPALAKSSAEPAGYDYASKFYPHPGWLYLLSEPPRERGEHSTVIVLEVQREQEGQQQLHQP